jgi:CRISPR/Cas system-associated exonuclease Cas4 (RecB family)
MFFPAIDRNEVKIIDSSAITTFMECHRKYFYRYVLGYKTSETFPFFAFGTAYHVFREVIEKEYLANPDNSKIDEYVVAGITRAAEYCDKNLPPPDVDSKWAWMTKERLIQSCIVGANHWRQEKLSGAIKVLAIEQPFQISLPDGVIIAGRADQIISWNGKIWGRDFKTSSQHGSYYVNTLNPNDQFSRYTYAENILSGYDFDNNSRPTVEGQRVDVLFNNKTTKPTIDVHLASRTKQELLNWLKEQSLWHKIMQMCRDEDVWAMNPKSCKFCEYRKVCTLGNEAQQMAFLKNNYKLEHWDCTKGSDTDAA